MLLFILYCTYVYLVYGKGMGNPHGLWVQVMQGMGTGWWIGTRNPQSTRGNILPNIAAEEARRSAGACRIINYTVESK